MRLRATIREIIASAVLGRQARTPSAAPLVAICALLAVAIVAAASLIVRDMRRQESEAVARGLTSLSVVLADQADRALQAMELAQDAVIQEFRDADVATPEEYAAIASRRALHDTLRARIASLPQVAAITVIDHAGKLLNFSRFWPIPDVNIADRDYFVALAGDPARQRFVSEPVQNRGDGAWTIYIARRVSAPDGTFLGLVLGAVDLQYFENLYREITPTDDHVVSVFREDGTLLVRYPRRNGVIGNVYPHAGAPLIAATNRSGGIIRNVSPIDHADRLISTRALANYPVILSISRTVEASMASFRQEAAIVIAAAGVLVSCLGALAIFVIRQARDRERLVRAEAARAAAEERARGQRDLLAEYARFGVALDSMIQGLCLFDTDHRLVVMNARFAQLHAIPRHLRDRGVEAARIRRHITDRLPETIRGRDLLIVPPDGEGAPTVTHVVDLSDDTAVSVVRAVIPDGGWVCTHEDISERRRNEERMRFLAKHDALTRLPNRLLFEEVVGRELGASAESGADMALLCLDLDGFKQINDLFGHPTGDELLVEVAERLRGLLGERCIAARLGGDEFAILAGDLGGSRTPSAVAQAVIQALSAPFTHAGAHVDVGCSVGIAVFPGDGETYAQLLSAADMALARAKRDGKGTYSFFEPEIDATARERHQLAQDLRAAIDGGQLEIHYQPQFEIASRRVSGFEALLRWNHPVRGFVPPGEFVPIAEETGLILPLGEWVLRKACQEAAGWANPLAIAVNLSIAQFRQTNLPDLLQAVLRETGLLPSRLELEVTESLFLKSTTRSRKMLRKVKATGVRISIDDFGTGYSSLLTLQSFPFDRIKIDRTFVSQIGVTDKGTAIVRAIIGLGESLGMPVIAEGIETEEQLAFLGRHRCAEMQGYLLGRPRPIGEYAPIVDQAPGAVLIFNSPKRFVDYYALPRLWVPRYPP